MSNHTAIAIAALALAALLAACGGNSDNQPGPTPPGDEGGGEDTTGATGGGVEIANPASGNCVEKGGQLEMQRGPEGEFGVCVFDDGSRCEEWRFFRGQCSPGSCQDESGICED